MTIPTIPAEETVPATWTYITIHSIETNAEPQYIWDILTKLDIWNMVLIREYQDVCVILGGSAFTRADIASELFRQGWEIRDRISYKYRDQTVI
jgi:hypothetical protein